MAKKKKKQPAKQKGMPVGQVYKRMQNMCDTLESVVLETLHKEFGFGDVRRKRFMAAFHQEMNAYLMAQEAEIRKQKRA